MSSENETESLKYCKFCFGTENDSQLSFVHPCRCKGTIHWVHNQCLEMWFAKANSVQQLMCIQCQTRYQKRMVLKSSRMWLIPRFDLDIWSYMEISLDIWITWKTLIGFVGMMNGTRSIFRELILCTMWKCFVASGRRFCYYGSLFVKLTSSIFHVSIDDYDERREIKARFPTDMNWEEISRLATLN